MYTNMYFFYFYFMFEYKDEYDQYWPFFRFYWFSGDPDDVNDYDHHLWRADRIKWANEILKKFIKHDKRDMNIRLSSSYSRSHVNSVKKNVYEEIKMLKDQQIRQSHYRQEGGDSGSSQPEGGNNVNPLLGRSCLCFPLLKPLLLLCRFKVPRDSLKSFQTFSGHFFFLFFFLSSKH